MRLGPHLLTPLRPDLPILTLAPMAGVGNWVFRLLCARLGARMVGVEFVNCRTLGQDSRRTQHALDFSDAQLYRATGLSVLAAQIYGSDPAAMAAGAAYLEGLGAQVVDINFGCSVPRILRRGSGAAYLRDLDALYTAVRLTVQQVTVPVAIKTRLGWDDDSINILEVVRRAQDAGAQAIAVHARTVRQRYGGRADWSWIGRAKEVARVPVIGNGDVRSAADARRLQEQTGCDAVMVGRAALANPWIFCGRDEVALAERIDLVVEQVQRMVAFKGERVGVRETRKHLALYFRDLPGSSALRRRLLTTDSLAGLLQLLQGWREEACDGAATDLTLTEDLARALAWGGGA
ncbi:MAG: tRNA-dihydrouridine synthase [Candidatus Latescibacterota bacterium]